jgi:hypothetical protein
MIEHIRYEITQVLNFAAVGNAWCESLDEPIRSYAARSILEAGLLHIRCLIEFLAGPPASDRVTANDYLPDWRWTVGENLRQVTHLHGRVAHLGVVRGAVRPVDNRAFSWQEWLTENAPVVLRGARDFLRDLNAGSPGRYASFVQPRPDLVAVDLIPLLNSLVR